MLFWRKLWIWYQTPITLFFFALILKLFFEVWTFCVWFSCQFFWSNEKLFLFLFLIMGLVSASGFCFAIFGCWEFWVLFCFLQNFYCFCLDYGFVLNIFFLHFTWTSLQENVPLEEVFQTLRCDSNGLTTEGAQDRLAIFGYNKLEEKKVFPFQCFFVFALFFVLFFPLQWKKMAWIL